MLITIHDNQMNKVGFLSNEAPEIPSFFNDTWHRYLAEGAATFSFSVNKFKNGSLQDYCQYLNDQAYISFRFDGQDHLFSVLTTEETDDVITLNCATLNLELRNEQVGPLVNNATHNIQWYFDQIYLFETAQINIGINEVSNLTRTISYDGQESKLSRLLSIIGNFNAEFEFITNLNDDGTFEGITLNIYQANDGVEIQGVGTWRNDVILYFGKNVTGVRRNVDRTQIFNASKVTGQEGLNWTNSEWSVKNSEGVEEFYKRKGATLAYAPLSAELYPAQIQSDGDRWIRKDFETEYKSVNDMWGYILSQFKKYAYALVTYEVSASSSLINQSLGNGKPLSIGDTVRIQDNNFNSQSGGLILQARVSELEISFSNPSNNKLTFSNYIELENGISDDLESRLAQLIKDNTPYRSEITTTNGIQFKNGKGSTTLAAHVYFGSDSVESTADAYQWLKDGVIIAPTQEITVDASGVIDKAVYTFKATIGDKIVGTQSVTITNVNDGESGSPGTPGAPGTDGRSVINIEQKYRLTTSSSIPTQDWNDSGWLTSQPTSTSTNKFLWSITRTTFNKAPLTQDVVEQKAVYGDKGTPGTDGNPGKVVSDTEPTTRFKGLTWKYSGTTDLTASDGTVIKPNTEYYYNGTHWMINYLSANNLEANSIKADKIDATDLEVTNGTFTNGKIKSTWTSDVASGSTEIETSHINMSATDSTSNATNSLGLDVQQGFGMRWTDPTSNQSRSVLLDYGNLVFDRNGIAAGLNFDGTNLSSSMPIQAPNTIVKSTQFTVSGIGIRLDRMMSFVAVTFSGQASSTINNTPTINNVLPVGFRPISPYSIDYMVPGNTANNGYIYFNPDGSIRIMATINSGYYIRGTRLYITNDVYPS